MDLALRGVKIVVNDFAEFPNVFAFLVGATGCHLVRYGESFALPDAAIIGVTILVCLVLHQYTDRWRKEATRWQNHILKHVFLKWIMIRFVDPVISLWIRKHNRLANFFLSKAAKQIRNSLYTSEKRTEADREETSTFKRRCLQTLIVLCLGATVERIVQLLLQLTVYFLASYPSKLVFDNLFSTLQFLVVYFPVSSFAYFFLVAALSVPMSTVFVAVLIPAAVQAERPRQPRPL